MTGQRAQSMVEFALVVGVVMFLVVAVGQAAVIEHYRSTLQLAAQEGAFEASLVGHEPADGVAQTRDLWARLEPGAGPIAVSASVQGDLVVVSAQTTAPALLPVPVPPFTGWPVNVRAVHTIERFAP
jgi:TadE-like protein